VFGDDFRRGPRARRITLALDDVSASKPATNRMLLFACVYLMAHGLGERVFDADGFLAAKWDIDHRKHHHRRAWLVWVLLDALGVTPAAAWGTQQDYGHREALGVVRLARGISRALRLHGLPAPKPKDDAKPHQYVGRLLRQLDLDTVRSQRTVTAIDGTKARISEYRVASASVREQLRRAGHALRVLVGDHGFVPPDPLAPWTSAGSQPVPVLPPRPAGPPRPAVADLEAAFTPRRARDRRRTPRSTRVRLHPEAQARGVLGGRSGAPAGLCRGWAPPPVQRRVHDGTLASPDAGVAPDSPARSAAVP
jgi:hypothetical protein